MIRNVLSWCWLGMRLAWELRRRARLGDAPIDYALTPKARREMAERDRRRWN